MQETYAQETEGRNRYKEKYSHQITASKIRLNNVFIEGSIIHQTARQQFHFLNLDF